MPKLILFAEQFHRQKGGLLIKVDLEDDYTNDARTSGRGPLLHTIGYLMFSQEISLVVYINITDIAISSQIQETK